MRERRSWRTWQLVVFVLVALLVGMAIGNIPNKGSSSALTTTYSLPPAAGAPTTVGTSATTTSAASPARGEGSAVGAPVQSKVGAAVGSAVGSPVSSRAGSAVASVGRSAVGSPAGSPATAPTTTAFGVGASTVAGRKPAGASATSPATVASGSAAFPARTTVVAQPAESILLPSEQHAGSWTTSRFTIGVGTWELAWQYQCSETREGPALQVLSAAVGSSSLVEVLVRYPLSGSGVQQYQQNVPVDVTLQVEADESCTSTLKAVEQRP